MGVDRPEIIFVAGPQAGQRGLIASDRVVLGRSAKCDVQVRDQAVSREQMLLELTGDGWVVQNIGSSNFRINGRKYKAGKQIILDTGDLVVMGGETEILYVAPGDDVDQALDAYRQTHQISAPVEAVMAPSAPSRADGPDAPRIDQSPTDQLPEAQPTSTGSIATRGETEKETLQRAEDDLDKAAKRKKVKYLLAFGAYAVVMVVVIVFLASAKKGNGPTRSTDSAGQRMQWLAEGAIRTAVMSDLDAPKQPTEADDVLRDALNYYAAEIDKPGYLYLAVLHFKLYKAYTGSPQFDLPEHERMALEAEDKLVDRIWNKYRAAWTYEQRGEWAEARDTYKELIVMLPVDLGQYRPAEMAGIVKNISDHHIYVRKQIETSKKRRR